MLDNASRMRLRWVMKLYCDRGQAASILPRHFKHEEICGGIESWYHILERRNIQACLIARLWLRRSSGSIRAKKMPPESSGPRGAEDAAFPGATGRNFRGVSGNDLPRVSN